MQRRQDATSAESGHWDAPTTRPTPGRVAPGTRLALAGPSGGRRQVQSRASLCDRQHRTQQVSPTLTRAQAGQPGERAPERTLNQAQRDRRHGRQLLPSERAWRQRQAAPPAPTRLPTARLAQSWPSTLPSPEGAGEPRSGTQCTPLQGAPAPTAFSLRRVCTKEKRQQGEEAAISEGAQSRVLACEPVCTVSARVSTRVSHSLYPLSCLVHSVFLCTVTAVHTTHCLHCFVVDTSLADN